MNELSAIWPTFGLTLTTPRLVLRPIQDADIPAAVRAALSGIHEPGKSPFSNPWTALPKMSWVPTWPDGTGAAAQE